VNHRLPVIIAGLAMLIFSAASAGGHAFLDRAEPRVGSKVKSSPRELRLYFTQNLEAAFSTAKVTNQAGQQVDKGDSHVDDADRTVLRLSLTRLQPGAYLVTWRVLSVDTHVTEGNFKFRVAQ
jgi:methionine-rich copper-binding protein CopC